MPRKKRYICHVHDEIETLAEELIEELEGKVTKAVIKKLKKIESDAVEARDYGQAMEDRLSVYKDGIENMGFKSADIICFLIKQGKPFGDSFMCNRIISIFFFSFRRSFWCFYR